MSLVLTRRPGESFHLFLSSDADLDEVARKLASTGIEVRINSLNGLQIKIGIDAPESIVVLREELLRHNGC